MNFLFLAMAEDGRSDLKASNDRRRRRMIRKLQRRADLAILLGRQPLRTQAAAENIIVNQAPHPRQRSESFSDDAGRRLRSADRGTSAPSWNRVESRGGSRDCSFPQCAVYWKLSFSACHFGRSDGYSRGSTEHLARVPRDLSLPAGRKSRVSELARQRLL
jgi:hypothetical protein